MENHIFAFMYVSLKINKKNTKRLVSKWIHVYTCIHRTMDHINSKSIIITMHPLKWLTGGGWHSLRLWTSFLAAWHEKNCSPNRTAPRERPSSIGKAWKGQLRRTFQGLISDMHGGKVRSCYIFFQVLFSEDIGMCARDWSASPNKTRTTE